MECPLLLPPSPRLLLLPFPGCFLLSGRHSSPPPAPSIILVSQSAFLLAPPPPFVSVPPQMLYSHVTLLMLRVVDVITKTSVQQSARMLVGELPGDIQIGALFPMHRQIAGAEGCGAIWEQYGIQRAEVAMLTVQELNRVLPFRLGISIRDSCWTERIAMEQTIAFLREGVTQCSCCQTAGCQKKANPVVAIVGPAKSSTTIAVQNLLQVFRIPQIGYSATTTDLSDKESFGYYLRVVPSDAWQAMAINQLLMHFSWTYIAVVYSAGNYGEKGFEAMERLTHIPGIDVCIAHAQKVKSLGEKEEFENALRALDELSPRPQVVVCFCEGLSMRRIFKAQKALRLGKSTTTNNTTTMGEKQQRRPFKAFQWIGSDGWADRLDVVDGVESEAAGSFSIRIHSPRVDNFEPYYFSLNPANHTKNPWFREFWQQKFKCLLTVPKDDTQSKLCNLESENLTVGYEQDPKLSQVMNAIRVVGYALRAMYHDKCPSHRRNATTTSIASSSSPASSSALLNAAPHHFGLPCPEMETINGTLLFRYMMNVTFEDEFQQEISFDQSGDPPAWYDILNYVGFAGFNLAGDFRQTAAGTYRLRMGGGPKLLFYDKTGQMPESVCSKPCMAGHIRRQNTACCWQCEPCGPGQIVFNNMCQKCPFGEWPARNRTNCVQLEHEYMEVTASWAPMVAIAFACAGIICAFLCILVFLLHNSTPVVKSTTRELSYIILGGIVACYLCTFVMLARPCFLACFVSRTLPPIAFSAIYSALFTKTNRIARILAGSKKRILTKKPRFLSTFSQVVITWALVGIQCVIVAVGVMQEMPVAGFDENFGPRRMVLICASSTWAFMAPFMWNFILVLFCTLYAFKTRNLPENFNEAKFIGFTMYCTLVTWGAFVVLYVNSQTVNKALTASFTFSLSASIALSLLFFPKIFIILLRPEKNIRSSYTTTKLIRCHFGNAQQQSSTQFTDSNKHISLSKTRNSSQSLSIGGSCPTRTASLHVVNHSGATNQSSSSTTNQSQPSPRRHMQTQTEISAIAFGHHGAASHGLTSRFTRTFSVIGGGGGGGGTIGGGGGGILGGGNVAPGLGKEQQKEKGGGGGTGGGGGIEEKEEKKERKSRRRTLDEDVMQLIDSCRRYQDERLLINPSTIENLLLEETDEHLMMGEEGDRAEKVTQLLAGTVRSLAQTVSRTAGSTPKMSSSSMYSQTQPEAANGSPPVQKQKEAAKKGGGGVGGTTPSMIGTGTRPTRSSIRLAGGEAKEKPAMRVDFAGNGKKKRRSDDGDEGGGEEEGQQRHRKEVEEKGSGGEKVEEEEEDTTFEQLLRSKGFNPVQFTNPTQL